MEKVKYWDLINSIPSGQFYNRDVIPYKTGVYRFVIDTLFPKVEYDVSWNAEIFSLISDISGLINFEVVVTKGKNQLKWRKVGEPIWKSVSINASNIGTLLGGLAISLTEYGNDIELEQRNTSILSAEQLFPWRFLYRYDGNLSRSQVEELVQAYWNWSEREKSVRQISAIYNNIPVTVERVGPLVIGGQWIVNNKYEDGIEGYNVVNGTIAVNNNVEFFGRTLRLTGNSVMLYPTVEYGWRGIIESVWIYRFFCRWGGMGSGNIRLGGSIDGVNWIWSSWFTFTGFNWRSVMLSLDKKPIKVAVNIVGTGDFTVEIGQMMLVNEKLKTKLPQVLGAWDGRKAVALWNWRV